MNDLLTQRSVDPTVEFPAAGVPTPPSPTTAAPRPRRWPLMTAIGVIALLCGVGVGVLVTLPQRSDLADQRDAARVAAAEVVDDLDAATASLGEVRQELAGVQDELTARGADLEAVEAELTTTLDEFATVSSELDGMTTNRDECLLAATTGVDLVTQWENFYDDEWAWLNSEYGSAAEAEIALHMDEQWSRMSEQHDVMHEVFDDCTSG
jgi:hypothetical protein